MSADNMSADNRFFYVTSYASDGGDMLRCFRFDGDRGSIELLGSVSSPLSRSFYLAPDRAGRYLFVTDDLEQCDGVPGGAVCAFAIDAATGMPAYLNRQSSGGECPCYIDTSANGRFATVANYTSGTLAVLPVGADGRLGAPKTTIRLEGSSVDKSRQEAPHAHSFMFDPAGRFALAGDLGTDRVMIYRFDADTGSVPPAGVPCFETQPGAGPRHLTFSGDGRFVWMICELDNTVIGARYDAERGGMERIEAVSALPDGFAETSYCADVHVHPSGRFLYGSNRGHESIVAFAINPDSGALSLVGHESTQGAFPRDFIIDPSGSFLLVANEHTHTIVSYRIDQDTGALTPTGDVAEVPSPTCCAFGNITA